MLFLQKVHLIVAEPTGYPNYTAHTKTSGLCVPYVGHSSTAKLK